MESRALAAVGKDNKAAEQDATKQPNHFSLPFPSVCVIQKTSMKANNFSKDVKVHNLSVAAAMLRGAYDRVSGQLNSFHGHLKSFHLFT